MFPLLNHQVGGNRSCEVAIIWPEDLDVSILGASFLWQHEGPFLCTKLNLIYTSAIQGWLQVLKWPSGRISLHTPKFKKSHIIFGEFTFNNLFFHLKTFEVFHDGPLDLTQIDKCSSSANPLLFQLQILTCLLLASWFIHWFPTQPTLDVCWTSTSHN